MKKLYTKEIMNCLVCPNREQEDRVNADGSIWTMVHTCTAMNRRIVSIDMHSVTKENVKTILMYKRGWFPDWCPLADFIEPSEE